MTFKRIPLCTFVSLVVQSVAFGGSSPVDFPQHDVYASYRSNYIRQ
jgi:hypothetical protein